MAIDGDNFVVGAYAKNSYTGKAYSGSVSSVTTLDTGNTSKVIAGISFISQDDWVIGQTTSTNQVTLSKGDTADVSASGKGIYIGKTAGSNNNTLLVQGTVTTNAATIGTTGTSGNKLEIANNAGTNAGKVTASSKITLNTGGTLLLSGTSAVTDRLGNATAIELAGGKLDLNNLSEGAAGTTGLGALSLIATSTLDFGAIAGSNLIQFSGVGTQTNGQILQITNWQGTPYTGNGTDRLLFAGTVSSFTSLYTQNEVSFNGTLGYSSFQYSGFYEIAAVPEPGTVVGGVCLSLLILLRRRTGHGPNNQTENR